MHTRRDLSDPPSSFSTLTFTYTLFLRNVYNPIQMVTLTTSPLPPQPSTSHRAHCHITPPQPPAHPHPVLVYLKTPWTSETHHRQPPRPSGPAAPHPPAPPPSSRRNDLWTQPEGCGQNASSGCHSEFHLWSFSSARLTQCHRGIPYNKFSLKCLHD